MNPFSKTTRHAGKKEVLATATRLMKHYGETTTLEVKLDLREQGFIAYQADVSHFMTELAREKNWGARYNGLYCTFTLEPLPEWLVELLLICPN